MLSVKPHPLMFDNYIKQGLMTVEEVNQYKRECEKNGISLIEGVPVTEIIKKADILITDFSSIMLDWFLTGKPMIYCDSSMQLDEQFTSIVSDNYHACSWSDVEKACAAILEGDPKKEKRMQAVLEERKTIKGAARRIAERILRDWAAV